MLRAISLECGGKRPKSEWEMENEERKYRPLFGGHWAVEGNREMGWGPEKGVGWREGFFKDRRYQSVFSGWQK